jgi:hypothetical protein
MKGATYLGDGVYFRISDRDNIEIFTWTGVNVKNRIFLDRHMVELLLGVYDLFRSKKNP